MTLLATWFLLRHKGNRYRRNQETTLALKNSDFMKTKIANVIKAFGSKIGLGSSLNLETNGTIRLNLDESQSFGIDFEEDPNGEKVWIYCELFPGIDMNQSNHLCELLQLMFAHHKTSDARLAISPDGFQLFLISSFSIPAQEQHHQTQESIDLLDEHLKNFVALAEILKSKMTSLNE
jgi:hypothetical protein